jgi:hypothetical protein
MAVLGTANPSLMDFMSLLDPNDSITAVIELLRQQNEMLLDATFCEGNLLTGHKTTVRTGLPAPTWRKLYGGVQPTKSTYASVVDNCGMLEAYAEVDKALADLNGNSAAFRLSEEKGHVEGMNQEVAQTTFYGNEGTEPEAFTGLAPRFASTTPESGEQIIKGGGSGADNMSVWLVGWSPETVCYIYPKGSKAGLQMQDLGEVTIENADGANGRMQAYRTHYRWDVGLCVRDWRYVVRICNIDNSDLTKNASAGADLIDLMIQATERMSNLNNVRPAFYANRTVRSFLRRQIGNKSNVWLSRSEVAGDRAVYFDNIPIRMVDQLLKTEATVS